MSSAPADPPQPNHRRGEPGPSILRSTRTNSLLDPGDASNEGEDTVAEVNARFEKLGRPRKSLEDYYGPGARSEHSDDLPRPSRLEGSSGKLVQDNTLTSQRDMAAHRSDATLQGALPFLYQQQFVPVFGPGLSPYSLPFINGEMITSASIPPGALPEYIVYRKAVTLPQEQKPSPPVRRPCRRSIPPLKRPRQDQPDHFLDVFRDAVMDHWLTGSNRSSPFFFYA
ncbi:hypothetical protein PLICRDRAFT_606113 [Plicaturopsis crispa FD-325 SS-3]|nr:hypothetical protein PLICRDRAFT_606113 [Plicaturopsis crispa FD-325 SS-3]